MYTINISMFKAIIRSVLERNVKRYFKAHPEVKLVVVTGSVGKTSTKFAIAEVLSQRFKVRFQDGNHNSELSVPLALLGIEYPEEIRKIGKWLKVFAKMRKKIAAPTDVDIIIQELGTDGIGQIPHFGKYLKPDIAVVSAVSPEHMEFFHTLDAVAEEELSVAVYSKQVLINGDDIDPKYQTMVKNTLVSTFGLASSNQYYFSLDDFQLDKGYKGAIEAVEIAGNIPVELMVFGAHSIRPVVAAAAVAIKLGMSAEDIAKGMAKIKPVPGRMSVLPGIKNARIIDDSYNSSPLAVKLALQTLYNLTSDCRIAVLGDMNELGSSSIEEHRKVGNLCDPKMLKMVITVGEMADKYLAPAAAASGCKVVSFKNSREAGKYLLENLPEDATILFKGSEGKIYLEEAVKPILKHPSLSANLVRQSNTWLKRKEAFFSSK